MKLVKSLQKSVRRFQRRIKKRLINKRIAGIHQLGSATAYDRYPGLFGELSKLTTPKRVLSFGCSTGEECATIKKYWPEAEVVGVDVNKSSLRKAKQRYAFAQFHHTDKIEKLGKFDLILAMSVLCRHKDTEGKENIARIYPFQMFEDAVGAIVERLNGNGTMVIFNSNYSFEDTKYAAEFSVLLEEEFRDEGRRANVRKFAPDGSALEVQKGHSVFVRNAGPWS